MPGAPPAAAARDARCEVSGAFAGPERWAAVWSSLEAPDCGFQQLRIYHATPEQVAGTAAVLERNTSVTSFEVGELDGQGAAAVAAMLKANTTITTLRLPKLAADAAAADALAAGLAAHPRLQHVQLGQMDDSCLGRLAAALGAGGTAAAWQSLELLDCGLDAVAAVSLHTMLLAQPQLARLQLSGVRLAARGAGAPPGSGVDATPSRLAALLTSQLAAHPCLSELSLAGSALCPGDGAALGSYLAAGPLCLAALVLRGCRLCDGGAAALCAGLSAAPALASLDLSENALGEGAAAALGGALAARPPALAQLNLKANPLGAGALAVLASGLGAAPALADLDLEACGLAGGVAPLAAVLEAGGGCAWRRLQLADNAIGDAGAVALAGALAGAPRLELLGLARNWLGDKGGLALAAAVRAHPALCALHVERCRMRNEGAEALVDAAFANAGITTLSLDGNRVVSPLLLTTISDLARALEARRAGASRRGSLAASSRAVSRQSSPRNSMEAARPRLGLGQALSSVAEEVRPAKGALAPQQAVGAGGGASVTSDAASAVAASGSDGAALLPCNGSCGGGCSGCALLAAAAGPPLLWLRGLGLESGRSASLETWSAETPVGQGLPRCDSLMSWVMTDELFLSVGGMGGAEGSSGYGGVFGLPTARSGSLGGGGLMRGGSSGGGALMARSTSAAGGLRSGGGGSGAFGALGVMSRAGSGGGGAVVVRATSLGQLCSKGRAGSLGGSGAPRVVAVVQRKGSGGGGGCQAAQPQLLQAGRSRLGRDASPGRQVQPGASGAGSAAVAVIAAAVHTGPPAAATGLPAADLVFPRLLSAFRNSIGGGGGAPAAPSCDSGALLGMCAQPGRIVLTQPVLPEPVPAEYAALFLDHLMHEEQQQQAAAGGGGGCAKRGAAAGSIAKRAAAVVVVSRRVDPLDALRSAASLEGGEEDEGGEEEWFDAAATAGVVGA